MRVTVYCVAAESSGTGRVNWHPTSRAADEQFDSMAADQDWGASTLTRFDLEVDDSLAPDAVTNEVDAAMWDLAYVPSRQRFGTDGVNQHARRAVPA